MNNTNSQSVAKNDNLTKYREKSNQQNEMLIQRAIEHIASVGGDITFSTVSKVTYDIADYTKGEKGLTLPAISKSKIYRPMIEKAQASNMIVNPKQKVKAIGGKYSVGDMQLVLHELRVDNAKLKIENKILAMQIKAVQIPIQGVGNIEESVIKKADEIKGVAHSMVNRLLELELAYLDTTSLTLNVALYDEVIVSYEALQLFYKKELDEIKSYVRS